MTIRTKLREELTARLVPVLRARGFCGPDRIVGNAIDYDYRRPAGTGIQRLSIQLDKRQRPRFVIDISLEPLRGMDTLLIHGGTLPKARVQPSWRDIPTTRTWFCADRPWWLRLVGSTASRERDAVSDALAMLEEIEQWWSTQTDTQHIRNCFVTYRSQDRPETSNQTMQRTALGVAIRHLW